MLVRTIELYLQVYYRIYSRVNFVAQKNLEAVGGYEMLSINDSALYSVLTPSPYMIGVLLVSGTYTTKFPWKLNALLRHHSISIVAIQLVLLFHTGPILRHPTYLYAHGNL